MRSKRSRLLSCKEYKLKLFLNGIKYSKYWLSMDIDLIRDGDNLIVKPK